MVRLLLFNGPNLDLLGSREPQVHDSSSLQQIERGVAAPARALGDELSMRAAAAALDRG
jgi:3-dehydroquinate dehydratase